MTPLLERRRLAARIRSSRREVAEEATRSFLSRHPDWVDRYGAAAQSRGEEDAGFHIGFLAAAVEAGEPRAFADYAVWAGGVLGSRGIAPVFLAENLRQIAAAVTERVGDDPLLQEAVAAASEAVGVGAPPPPSRPVLETERRLYVRAALAGQRGAALGVAQEAVKSHSHLTVYADLIEAAQHEIGRSWERSEITVAQEHVATAVSQFVLAALFVDLPAAGTEMGRAMVLGVEGEMHQLGPQLVSDALEADGWSVDFLGSDVPVGDVVSAVGESPPDLIGLSVTLLPNLEKAIDVAVAIRDQFGEPSPRIVCGGRAFAAAPRLAREVGGVHAEDVMSAVAVARDG